MPAAGVPLLTLALCAVALRARLHLAAAALLGAWLLVPGTLAVPGAPAQLFVTRAVLYAFAIGLVLRRRRGELAGAAFRPTAVHAAFALFLAVTFVTGVALAGDYVTPADTFASWLRIVDQAVFFVCLLAVARSLDVLALARLVAGLVVASACIGIVERTTGWGWSPWFFAHLPEQGLAPGAFGLAQRGGEFRARAASQFALEFAWVTTLLLPLVVAVFAWSRRLLTRLLPGVVVLAVVWSWSRSAIWGIAAGAALLAVLSKGDRRIRPLLAAGAVAAVAVVVVVPGVRQPFDAAGKTASIDIRRQRLPVIADAVADRPYQGLGFTGLDARAIRTTDISYVLLYASTGIAGLVAFCALLATGVRATLGAWRAPPGPLRAIGAAVAVGAVLVPVAAAAYDFSSVPQSTWALWLLVALGIAVREEIAEPAPARHRSPLRLALPALGALAGTLVAMGAPAHVAVSYQAEVVSPYRLAVNRANEEYLGQVLVNTACGVVEAVAPAHRDAKIECLPLYPFHLGPGLLRVRVEAADGATARRVADETATALRRALTYAVTRPEPVATPGRSTLASTAPVWLAAVAAILAVLVPPLPAGRLVALVRARRARRPVPAIA